MNPLVMLSVPVHRPLAIVIFGVRLSWSRGDEIMKLVPVISKKYSGKYEDDPEEFLSEASMGIDLNPAPYKLWQPNNYKNAQNYIVLKSFWVGENQEDEYSRVKQPSMDEIIEFKRWLAALGIKGKYRQYLVFAT